MLTRLYVDGFKNLEQLELRFGPLTCVAGANGVGKSNIFDAIAFLAALADKPLDEAALSVRGAEAARGGVANLFRRSGGDSAREMRFEVDFIVPEHGEDDLGQRATASMTFLRYTLCLRLRPDPILPSRETMRITHEDLIHINKTQAREALAFPHSAAWRNSVVLGKRSSPYISTDTSGEAPVIALHMDSIGGQGGGKPRRLPADSLPRTMLSSVSNAMEHRTLVLARQTMSAWQQLQLEPSALRAADDFAVRPVIGPSGEHVPATLYDLAQRASRERGESAADVYARVADRLSQLVEDVCAVGIDVDEKRQLLSIVLTDRSGVEHFASSLSDGTLRFLALAVMESDPQSRSLVCLEEPENGMHPERVPSMMSLLADLAVDTSCAVDRDNPLRQVIVNTHSPSVVRCISEQDLLHADSVALAGGGVERRRLVVRCLRGTWRHDHGMDPVPPGAILPYLNPPISDRAAPETRLRGRVEDRDEFQGFLPFASVGGT